MTQPGYETALGRTQLYDGYSAAPTVSELFVRVVNSRKLECTGCGRRGYPWDQWYRGEPPPAGSKWWALGCLRGHAPCPRCGRQLAVKLDDCPRMHTRCPRRAAI